MNHRAYVGPENKFEEIGKHQFEVLKRQGLKKHHTVLDYGCGSLRAGQYIIPWLYKGRYTGVDVDRELVEAGVKAELNGNLKKKPTLIVNEPDTYEIPEGPFDFILMHSILSHAPWRAVGTLLQGCSEALKEGKVLFTFNPVNPTNPRLVKEYTGEDWVYPAGVAHDAEHLKSLLERLGFGYEFLSEQHPSGQQWVVAQKI